jgi:hypothetical protein
MMDENGELVTAKKLLELHDASLVEGTTLVEKMVDPGHASKIEVIIDYGSDVGCLVAVKEAFMRLGSVGIVFLVRTAAALPTRRAAVRLVHILIILEFM